MTDEYTPDGGTTPTEDEARAALAQRRQEAREADARETREHYGAMAASRVSIPPSEAVAQALAFATKERDEIRGRYAQTGGSPARYLGYADACDDIISLLQGEATYPIPAVPVPPTDEEDAEDIEDALITLLLDEGLESARGYGQPTATDVAAALLKKFAIGTKGEA